MESYFEQKKIRQSNSNFLATLSDMGVDVVVSSSSQASIRLLPTRFCRLFSKPHNRNRDIDLSRLSNSDYGDLRVR